MSDLLHALQAAGYDVSADSDTIHLRWRRQEPPQREVVEPLLAEASRRKPDLLAALVAVSGRVNAGQRPSGVATLRLPKHPRASAAHRERQGASLDRPGPVLEDEATRPSTSSEALEPQGPDAHEPAAPVELTRCGWCGSRHLWPADTGSGRLYCQDCHGVYNPSQQCWSPGEAAKRQGMGTPAAPSSAATASDGG